MRRAMKPGCELLENKTLLSGSTAVGATAADVKLTLATDKTSYAVGQSVDLTLTETNTSDQTVSISDGPSVDVFTIFQDGHAVWNSAGGLDVLEPLFVYAVSLSPGQSYTVQAVWDGSSNIAQLTGPTGTFEVQFGSIEANATPGLVSAFTVQTTPVAPSPAPSTPIAVILTTDHVSYPVGQPVGITLTVTNTSDQDVTIGAGSDFSLATIEQNGVKIWNSEGGKGVPYIPLATLETLTPGQSYTVHVVWDGQPNLNSSASAIGTYQAQIPVEVDGASSLATTTFNVEPLPIGSVPEPPPVVIPTPSPTDVSPITPPPLTLTVVSEPQTARLGRPVRFVLKETNTSRQDVVVQTGQAALSASMRLDATTVWELPSSGRPGHGILRPGQSRRIVFVWNGHPNQPGVKVSPGFYRMSATIDGLALTTSFLMTG